MPMRERPAGRSTTYWTVSVYTTQPTGKPRATIRRTVEFLYRDGVWTPHIRHLGFMFQVYQTQGEKYILTEESTA